MRGIIPGNDLESESRCIVDSLARMRGWERFARARRRLHRASRFFDRSTIDHVPGDGRDLGQKPNPRDPVTVTLPVAFDESVSRLLLFSFLLTYIAAFIVSLRTLDFLEIKSCTFIKVSHQRFNFPYRPVCKLFLYLDGTTIRFLDTCTRPLYLRNNSIR